MSLEKEKETFCVMFTYAVMRARELEVSFVSRATTAKKSTKKRDALAKLLFCCLNLSGFLCRCRYCGRRRCLISALLLSSRNLATMVT